MTDRQNRVGGKTGGGGLLSGSQQNADRKDRLRRLAMETIDLNKDPYFMRNHLGKYECKLCMSIHLNEGSYLAHTQGKKHKTNLLKRAQMDAKNAASSFTGTGASGRAGGGATGGARPPPPPPPPSMSVPIVRIGKPAYKITKLLGSRNVTTGAVEGGSRGLFIEVSFRGEELVTH
jgi:splicing factor 3A subunit 2